MRKLSGIYGFMVMGSFLFLLTSHGEGANVTVDCSSQSLQAAIYAAPANSTISVKGTCNENVVINENKMKITLDGLGTATIQGDTAATTVTVTGRGTVIKRLHIAGGYNGISVANGGTATISGNIIDLASNNGVVISSGSVAFVVKNTILNNANNGIEVHDNATAHIGFVNYSDTTAQANTIRSNGSHGINVSRSSSASIVGNVIRINTNNGIKVQRDSHADISGNTINNNGANGIRVETNSGVNLGNEAGTSIFDFPNSTTVKNGNKGISCDIGGYADGLLGTLNGVNGATGFSNGCFDNLL